MSSAVGAGLALIHPHGATVIKARVYRGHWIADCGNPYCHTAMRLEYGAGYICSGDEDACGWTFDVEWPDEEGARAIAILLSYRPDPQTRNWQQPETPTDLYFENVAHGVGMNSFPEVGGIQSHVALDATGSGDPRVVVLDRPAIQDVYVPEVES